jgi:hypothetical protein
MVDMGKITQGMERKVRRLNYFFMLDRWRIPINAIKPIVIPNKKPITAINFVPSHWSSFPPHHPSANMTTPTASILENQFNASLMGDSLGIDFTVR